MHSPDARAGSRVWYQNHELLFWLGIAAWLLVMAVRWPMGLSYSDEIGYLGQAKLFLQGHIRWIPGAPGIWNPTPNGPVAQYPLLIPSLLAPLFAISPRAIFLVGVAPAIALAWTSSRILKSWGVSPCWGLLFLAHPTMVVLARTAMSDLLLSACALGAWWTLRNRRVLAAIALLGATMAARPTGVPIAAALVVGDLLERRRSGDSIATTLRDARPGILGLTFGMILVFASNVLTTGTIFFGYNYRPGIPSFRLAYLLTSAPAHLRTVLLNPPLLIVGALAFWRRRLWAPLLAIAAMGALMSVYVWVDWGPTWIETVVLSARLILPIVAFLLLGYAAVLAKLAARFRLTQVAAVLLVIAPAAIAFKIASRHQVWQQPMRDAREIATATVRRTGGDELGLNYASSKAGLLFPGKTVWLAKDAPRPRVMLCATRGNSYRDLNSGNPDEGRCAADGYHPAMSLAGGFVLMLRDGVPLPPD